MPLTTVGTPEPGAHSHVQVPWSRENKDLYFSVSPCETGLAPHQEPGKCLTLEFNASQTEPGTCARQGELGQQGEELIRMRLLPHGKGSGLSLY